MSRGRRPLPISRSQLRKILRRFKIGSDEVGDQAIRKRHLWPHAADEEIVAPGSIGPIHLDTELQQQLGKSTVHHVTATAVASQSIAAGGATVQWGDEADAPTEREGFDTFSTELAAGSVGDIPIDRDGFLLLIPDLQFEDTSGTALDTSGVDVTVKVQRVRDGAVTTFRGALTGTDAIGVSGPLDGWVKRGDHVKVTIDPGEGIKVSGTLQAALWLTGQSATSSWTQVFVGDVWGLTRLDGSWWGTEGNSGDTVTEYDTDWNVVSSFEAGTGNDRVRGITDDGTDLWLTGDGSTNEEIIERTTAGTLQSSFVTGSADDVNRGLAHDGTDLWLVEAGTNEIERWSTGGTREAAFSLPAGADHYGLTYRDGHLWVVDQTNAQLLVYTTGGALVDTVDVSGATDNPTGVWIDADGTLYVSEDGAGVWRRD